MAALIARLRPALPSYRVSVFALFLALSCAAAAASATIMGLRARSAAFEAASKTLGVEAKLAASQLTGLLRQTASHADAVSQMPPVTGLVRAAESVEGGPARRPGTAGLKRELEAIFTAVMAATPHYTQMRLISAEADAMELVRVNRRGDRLLAAPPEALQAKGGEPYVRAARALTGDRAYFSRVTLNREHGRISPDETLTIRIMTPVRATSGRLFGWVVVNAAFPELLLDAMKDAAPGRTLYILTGEGHHLAFSADGSIQTIEVRGRSNRLPPAVIGAGGVETDGDSISRRHKVQLNGDGAGADISVILAMEADAALAAIEDQRRLAFSVVFILGVVAAALATFGLEAVLHPLRSLLKRHGASGVRDFSEFVRIFEAKTSALTRSETLARAMLDNATDGVITIDDAGQIESFNRACEKIFGFEEQEVLGRDVSMLMPEGIAASHSRYLQNAGCSPEKKVIGHGRELLGRKKSGDIFPIELSVASMIVDGKRYFTGILRDISVRKAAEARVERLLVDLSESNQELETFAYVASHDLRAPLRAIDNTSSWLEEDLGEQLTGENLENMQFLRGRVRRMEKLLDDLLEYSRIGRICDHSDEPNIPGDVLLQDTLQLVFGTERFKIVVSPDFANISLPRMPLQQIMYNLINNAIKHHHRGDGTIIIDVSDLDEFYEISVQDDGPGVAKEYQDQIFELFQTLKPRDEVEGSGIGLAIVRKHVRLNGGSLDLTSDEGAGCRFRILWPK